MKTNHQLSTSGGIVNGFVCPKAELWSMPVLTDGLGPNRVAPTSVKMGWSVLSRGNSGSEVLGWEEPGELRDQEGFHGA